MTSTLRAYRPPPPLPINDLQEVTSKGQSKESGQLMLPKYLQVGDDFKGRDFKYTLTEVLDIRCQSIEDLPNMAEVETILLSPRVCLISSKENLYDATDCAVMENGDHRRSASPSKYPVRSHSNTLMLLARPLQLL
ncbi:hypothetical protein EB796_005828 [Bugula neritina]|uniref:Uncharacterized protein n=1 Tax=Bugula neritina TaxID=10212 RepID=A0A7J7KE22_BUGNE|nr:hypothetical protein EB796_005828 [Bugula neritina]